MKGIIIKLRRYGITSDTLKVIATVAMVIDHIAYYFYNYLPDWLYDIMRYGVGRIVMPIFVYMLVQGFFNTQNYKKYLLRISICGIVTQILIAIGFFINQTIFTNYITNVYSIGNILISFALTLILLKIIHEPILISKYDKQQNLLFKLAGGIILLSVYIYAPIDYGITVPLLAIIFYAIERFRITVLISKNNISTTFQGVLYKTLDDLTIKQIYGVLILIAILFCWIFGDLYWTAIFAVIPIYLYNGERRRYNKKFKYYVFFPIHHFVFYMLAMVLSKFI